MNATDPEENAYLRTAFLKRVAHELRGPAGVIHSVLQELEAALGDRAAEQQELLTMARRGVQRIVRTADRLQETAQLEAGEVQLTRTRADLGLLIRGAVSGASAIEGRRSITVDLQIPERPIVCDIDARWIGTAVYELTSNAIRHARARVQVSVVDDPALMRVEVTVTDDSRATSEFGPARFRSRRPSRGLGLSLAIVRDVAEAHGGALEIDLGSSAGLAFGARVRLWLPRSCMTGDGVEAEVEASAP
jgi:signal transduction histidine kinase